MLRAGLALFSLIYSTHEKPLIAESHVVEVCAVVNEDLWWDGERRVPIQHLEAQLGCRILNTMAQLGMPDSYRIE